MSELSEQQLYKTDVLASHGYSFIKFLNRGGFGRVVMARDEKGSTPGVRAIKILINPNKDDAVHEVTMNRLVKSDCRDCFVRLRHYFMDNLDHFFIFEYMAGGNLYSWLRKHHPQGTGFKTVQVIARRLFQALDFLEQRSIIHADLKPDNVLLASPDPNSLKVADFGLASVLLSKDAPVVYPFNFQVPNFRAPEVYCRYPTHSVLAPDVWGVGCILIHVILGKRLFPYSQDLAVMDYLENYYSYLSCPPQHMLDSCPFGYIKDIDRSKFPKNSKELLHLIVESKKGWSRSEAIAVYDVLHRALDMDPETRIRPGAALKHPFLRSPSS